MLSTLNFFMNFIKNGDVSPINKSTLINCINEFLKSSLLLKASLVLFPAEMIPVVASLLLKQKMVSVFYEFAKGLLKSLLYSRLIKYLEKKSEEYRIKFAIVPAC